MKIKSIEISGFGRWNQIKIDDISDWQVVYGQNESGKSTLKNFILGILFGFKIYSKEQRYEPISKAMYGGRLVIETKNGQFEVSRFHRTKTELTIRNLESGDNIENPEEFLQNLFSPLTYEDYLSIFAFDEHDLNAVSQLTNDDFEKKLLSYTQPLAQSWLNFADDKQKLSQGQFSKSKISKKPLNLLSRQYDVAVKAQESQNQDLKKYLLNDKKRLELEKKLAEAKVSSRQHVSQVYNLDELNRSWQLYEEAIGLEKAGFSDFSENDSATLTAKQNKAKELVNNQNWLHQQIQEINQKVAALQEEQSKFLQSNHDSKGLESVREKLNRLQSIQEKIARVNSQINQFRQYFTGSIPAPLNENEVKLLQQKNNWFGLSTTFAILTFLIFFAFKEPLLAVLSGILTVVSIVLANRHYQQKKLAVQAYDPLDIATILNAQGAVQKADDAQNNLVHLGEQEKQMAEELVNAIQSTTNDFVIQADTDLNINQLMQQAKQLLNQNEQQSVDDMTLNINLKQALSTQQNLYQKRDLLSQSVTEFLQENQISRLADFDLIIEKQREQQSKNQRYQDIKAQIGLKLWDQLTQFTSREELIAALNAQDDQQNVHEQQIQEIENELRHVEVEEMSLASDSDYQELSQQIANQETDLKNQFSDFLAQALVINVVKSAFEMNNDHLSDKVQKIASKYFNQLTNHKYDHLILNDNQILAVLPNETHFKISELSTGTKDQVYLSVRLALVEVLDFDESFPILVDDAFVNFDGKRKKEVLSLLMNLSDKHQLLFWSFDQELSVDNRINLGDIE